jgi:hypothetical protein
MEIEIIKEQNQDITKRKQDWEESLRNEGSNQYEPLII